jgi:hypothetical protein
MADYPDQDEDQGITAYHGSPHEFDQFDLSKIGTGEGAQAYGHGLYFAEAEPTAKIYRDTLSTKSDPLMDQYGIKPGGDVNRVKNLISQYGENIPNVDKIVNSERERWRDELSKIIDEKKVIDAHSNAYADETRRMLNYINDPARKRGHMYEVRINAHPEHFLDWDSPLTEQSEHVQNVFNKLANEDEKKHGYGGGLHYYATDPDSHAGSSLYQYMASQFEPEKASKMLHDAGIKGIKYLDQGSRGAGEGSRNYVVFDDKLVTTKRRYADGGEVFGYSDFAA